jgi:membrane fusion protein (multidrug efflux system)
MGWLTVALKWRCKKNNEDSTFMASKFLYPALAVVGMAVAGGAAWWYQSQPAGPKEMTGANGTASAPKTGAGGAQPARAAGVEVSKVEKISLQDDAQSVGSLRSRQSVMLRPEVAGRVKELGFADGARVRKGQLLVQLDDTLQRAELSQSKAQVAIAQANHKRNQELVAQNFVAQRVLDESSAALQVAQAQLALSEARLSRMAIVAPFDGTLGLRNVNLGDYVKDGADLVNLEDTSTMLVDFRLPERFQRKLKLQQTVSLSLEAFPGRIFKARIEAIDPLLDANARSVGVRAALPNTAGEPAPAAARPGAGLNGPASPQDKPQSKPDTKPVVKPAAQGSAAGPAGKKPGMGGAPGGGPLRPGMFARVTAIFGVNDAALVVPEEAIVPQGGRQFVIRVVEPSAVPAATNLPPDTQWVSLRQEVKLGVRRQGKVEITEGLLEDQTIVVAGQQRLQKDGTAVRIVEFGKPPGAATGPAAGASAPAGAASPTAVPASAASR